MNLCYADARRTIIEQIRKQKGPINLIIEAPLSVCFDANHNPKGRTFEKRDSKTRYWYTGLGCAVMTAAMYLIRDIHEAMKDLPNVEIRLFEGFVSFKEGKTDDKKDVRALREKIKNAQQFQGSIYSADELKFDESDELFSAFRVASLDCGIPAVIVAWPIPEDRHQSSSIQSQPSLSRRM